MNWNSAADFWAMGGHGYFVWMSYGLAVALLVLEPLLARARHRKALADAAKRQDINEEDAT